MSESRIGDFSSIAVPVTPFEFYLINTIPFPNMGRG